MYQRYAREKTDCPVKSSAVNYPVGSIIPSNDIANNCVLIVDFSKFGFDFLQANSERVILHTILSCDFLLTFIKSKSDTKILII